MARSWKGVAHQGDDTMMRAIFGSAAGGAVAGAIALAASAAHAPRAIEPAWPQATGATGSAYAMPIANTPALRSAFTNAPTLVDCEPGQRAVLQQSIVDNREVARVACVTEQPSAPMSAYAAPVGYYDTRPVYPQPDIVQRPAVRTAAVASARGAGRELTA